METTDKPTKKFYKRWWFWLIAIVVLLVVIGASGDSSTSQTTDQGGDNSPAQSAPKEEAIAVTATDLMRAYEANEVAADAQYKGKLLRISGTIDNIGKDILDTPYVSLTGGSKAMIFGIQCMFDKSDQAQLAGLVQDARITLQGRGKGKLGNVLVEDCSIVQ